MTSLFEDELKAALDRLFRNPVGSTPPHLAESIRYSLLAPGKRIRPRLLLSCAEMLGIPYERALPAAVALEMIHCFTLIHDDLPCMDNDDFRRGMPSNHKKFGESLALLAGDSLIALALSEYLKTVGDPHHIQAGLIRLVEAFGPCGVMGGQAAESLLTPQSQLEDVLEMHRQKTGALFSAALLIPMELGGISESSPHGKALSALGRAIGKAFQIADDLEDPLEDPTFKPVPTHILFYVTRERARDLAVSDLAAAAEALPSLWGGKTDALMKIVQELMRKLNPSL